MTTAGFGGEGPVVVPTFIPRLSDDDERAEEEAVEEASPDDVAEATEVLAHLDDPEIEAAFEHLRETRD